MKKLVKIVAALAMIAIGAVIVWAKDALPPMDQALQAMQSTPDVRVSTQPFIDFIPRGQQPDSGVIFYPGGKVDPRAYSPLAMALAEQGYLVSIVPMPLNLAMFGYTRADEVMSRYPQIEQWLMAGHSLGGTFAAQYTVANQTAVSGLALLASYPADSADLSLSELPVLSITASEDTVISKASLTDSRARLPASTRYLEISGGNHARFGWYGKQAGDGVAAISHESQQQQVTEALLDLLAELR